MNSLLLRSLVLVILILLQLSCRQAIKNPETIDPIYQDLNASLDQAKKSIESAQKDLADLEQTLATEAPGSLDRKLAAKKRLAVLEQLEDLRQDFAYLTIKVDRRRLEGRGAYLAAFERGESWPSKAEVDAYRANKRLKSAPKEWSARVPRLSSRIPASNKE